MPGCQCGGGGGGVVWRCGGVKAMNTTPKKGQIKGMNQSLFESISENYKHYSRLRSCEGYSEGSCVDRDDMARL